MARFRGAVAPPGRSTARIEMAREAGRVDHGRRLKTWAKLGSQAAETLEIARYIEPC